MFVLQQKKKQIYQTNVQYIVQCIVEKVQIHEELEITGTNVFCKLRSPNDSMARVCENAISSNRKCEQHEIGLKYIYCLWVFGFFLPLLLNT